MNNREVRTFNVSEIRAIAEEGSTPKIVGHAADFNSMSQEIRTSVGNFFEIIAPGAFTESLLNDDVRALWNHDANIVLGRNKSGTLTLREDEKGLAFEIDAPDTQLVRDMVLSPINRGDVSQCSFGFTIPQGGDKWEKRDGKIVRTIIKASVSDVSPVTYPAYRSTDVAVRSMESAFKPPVEVDTTWQFDIQRKRLDLA